MIQGLLGNAIREARIANGFSQEELAEKIGVTPTHIKHIEGSHRQPSINVLYDLVMTLNLSLDNVFFNEPDNKTYKQIKILLSDCNEKQLQLIFEIISSIKNHT